MLNIHPADPSDAPVLAEIQKRTFDEDALKYRNKAEDGPPGYDSVAWQAEMMKKGHYYKLLADGVIIGGMIVFPASGEDEFLLLRIFIDPLQQNRGFGQEAFHYLFASYPSARRWTLDTPSWAVRNHHFYKKMGFVQTGVIGDPDSQDAFFEYERISSNVTA
ncbi:GNAT family N-acetyltransferase [Paenibacillus sp. sgz500992]|uniref:GNAT family N-acetyltransferase n=1 Tax=Paenibacillus sp. sgz500992 TaxID=3242476 RepID=UPI0036D2D3FA